MRRLATALAVVVAGLACLPAWASAADGWQPVIPQALDARPDGFSVSGRESIRSARRAPEVAELTSERGRLRAIPGQLVGTTNWRVSFFDGPTEVARVTVSGVSGARIGDALTGHDLARPSARGVGTTFRDRLEVATLVLCFLFLLPFVDLRRPRRMLHLDLAALASLEVSFLLLQNEHLDASVYTLYPPLVYLLGRLLWLGLRARGGSDEPAVPYASERMLAVGLGVLIVARLAYNIEWGAVGDVGYAGLFGADSLRNDYALYGESSARLDAYGPLNYVYYLPFEALFPLGPGWSHENVEGAHLATIVLDLAVIGSLVALGRTMAAGAAGRRLGLALGYAWAAYPLAFFALAISTNDQMVALAIVLALLGYRSPLIRGAVLGLGAAAKFAPLALVPLFALGWRRSWRDAAVVTATAGGIFLIAFAPYVADLGLTTVWDSTIGFQLERESPFTLWGLHPSLDWLQLIVQAAAICLLLSLTVFPRTRDVWAVAALSAAAIIALQLGGSYWAHTYPAWFVAPALVAFVARAPRARP